jgi:hypothetical protein
MYPVAVELGFTGKPQDLDDDTVAIDYVVRLLNRRLIPFARKDDQRASLEELFDAYNTDNPRDANIPHAYIQKGLASYATAQRVLAAGRERPT